MKYTVLVDDLREIKADIVLRDYQSAIDRLSKMKGLVSELYMDHDLGEDKTGYDVIRYLTENDQLDADRIIIVSSNPVGRDNIGFELVRYGYRKVSPTEYRLYNQLRRNEHVHD